MSKKTDVKIPNKEEAVSPETPPGPEDIMAGKQQVELARMLLVQELRKREMQFNQELKQLQVKWNCRLEPVITLTPQGMKAYVRTFANE